MPILLSYFLLTFALLTLFAAMIPLLGDAHFSFAWFLAVLIAMLVAGPLWWNEWRRSRRSISMFSIVMLTIPLVSSASVAAWFQGERLPALVVAALCLVLLALLSAVLWRDYRMTDQLPNRLSERFLDEDSFEDDGVQWVVQCTGHDASTPLAAIVYLQNNLNVERTVRVRFRTETPFAGGGRALRFAPTHPVVLPPAAEATVTIPFVAADERPRAKISAYVYVDGRGAHGRRLRRQRVRAGPRPTARIIVLLCNLTGHLTFNRGGVRIALRSSGAASRDIELPPMTAEVIDVRPEPVLFGG